jgi:hypothetical protein
MRYSAFGLVLDANRPVAGLLPVAGAGPVDTRIWLDAMPPRDLRRLPAELWYVSDEGEPAGLCVWRIAGGEYFTLLYADGTQFVVDRAARNVWTAWADSSTLEDTLTYLLGPVLGFVLRMRGATCLHASAVAVGGQAVALVGPATAGKSTLAAAFSQAGHAVLSDDAVALAERDGRFCVRPAYPRLRLWPETVERLYGSADALPALTPTWEKRALDLAPDGGRFQPDPLPLAAVYILAERGPHAEPRFESLRRSESLLQLIANTYVGYLLDAAGRREEFTTLGRLVDAVPVRRVVPADDVAGVARLTRRMLEDFERTACTASPTTAR